MLSCPWTGIKFEGPVEGDPSGAVFNFQSLASSVAIPIGQYDLCTEALSTTQRRQKLLQVVQRRRPTLPGFIKGMLYDSINLIFIPISTLYGSSGAVI